MTGNKKNTLHIGADLEDMEFVKAFREYCLKEDFKQKTLVERLTKWWMAQDQITQEHIYRGRLSEAHAQIAEAAQGRAAVVRARAKAQTKHLKRKQVEKPSKSA